MSYTVQLTRLKDWPNSLVISTRECLLILGPDICDHINRIIIITDFSRTFKKWLLWEADDIKRDYIKQLSLQKTILKFAEKVILQLEFYPILNDQNL